MDLPANLAVAYNSTFSYSLVQVGENNSSCPPCCFRPSPRNAAGRIIRSSAASTASLKSVEYQHPFCNRTGKLFAGDNFVTNDTGTGFRPHRARSRTDDGIGRANGLPIYSPVNDDGALAYTNDLPVEQQCPPRCWANPSLAKHGKERCERSGVARTARPQGAVASGELSSCSYPHCWRSKTPIIFRAMDQWFIKIGDGRSTEGKLF